MGPIEREIWITLNKISAERRDANKATIELGRLTLPARSEGAQPPNAGRPLPRHKNENHS